MKSKAVARLSALTKKTAKRQRKITISIGGKQYRLLERVARAMSTVGWCGRDNTAKSIFDEFVWPFAETLLHDRVELVSSIVDSIATGADGFSAPEPLHSARLAALTRAFERFGLTRPESSALF